MKSWFVACVAAALLWRFPPDRYGFYPRCPVYETFGLLCPGCGATRAAAALLHGHVIEALQWNALFVVAVCVVLLYKLVGHGAGIRQTPPAWMVAAALGVTVLFGFVRNFG